MKKCILRICVLIVSLGFIACGKNKANELVEETYATGNANVFVEESVVPIFDDINQVFMNTYDKASIQIIPNSENQIVNLILQDSAKIAVLPRKLTPNELKRFNGKKIVNQTPFAQDAIIFINSRNSNDSLVDINAIVNLLKNPEIQSDKVFVFDNINSSLSQYFKNLAKITSFGNNVYFANDTKEVIDYTLKNSKAIGIVGVNWLLQPDQYISEIKKDLKSLKVLNTNDNKYYLPTQSTIADRTYPLIRDLYIIESQGKTGLGKGISNFAASDRGQRLVLKSGLFPYKQPTREIIINEN